MGINSRNFIYSRLLWLSAIVLILVVSITNGQTRSSLSAQEEVPTVTNPHAGASNVPVFTEYRGVRIGMTAEGVRSRLDELKKSDGKDLLVVSERESAQIYYDDKSKVMALSIDYFGDDSGAPTPETVLGVAIQAKADGSMYRLERYPEAGYWVSYNRTAGDKPIVTITMQKM